MDFKEAAHKLQMTVDLLKWCSSYSPKADGRKLDVSGDGMVGDTEVTAFDSYLRDPWPNKHVPYGIQSELRREAHGACVCCDKGSAILEMAHIDRKDKELPYHCQHPHNVVMLCRDCHGRYDSGDKQISNDVVKRRKVLRRSAMMEDVTRDIMLAQKLDELLPAATAAALAARIAPGTYMQAAYTLFDGTVAGLSAFALIPARPNIASPNELAVALTNIGGRAGVGSTTAASLAMLAHEVTSPGDGSPSSGWEHIPTEGQCERCCGPAMLGAVVCAHCEEIDYSVAGEEQYTVELVAGGVELLIETASPDREAHACPKCGATVFDEVHYQEYCAYCDHQWVKLQAE